MPSDTVMQELTKKGYFYLIKKERGEVNLVTKVYLGEAEGLQVDTGCSDGWGNALR